MSDLVVRRTNQSRRLREARKRYDVTRLTSAERATVRLLNARVRSAGSIDVLTAAERRQAEQLIGKATRTVEVLAKTA